MAEKKEKDTEMKDVGGKHAASDAVAETTTAPSGGAKIVGHEKRTGFVVVAVIVVLAAALGVWAYLYSAGSQSAHATERTHENTTHIIAQGDMSDKEAQAMLDEQARSSQIIASVAKEVKIDESGRLRLNMRVIDGEDASNPGYVNNLDQRIWVVQDDAVIYESDIVKRGNTLEWTTPTEATPGIAYAHIQGVTEDGNDSGNAIVIPVTIKRGQ